MKGPGDTKITQLARAWERRPGEYWYIVFDLAEIDGRLECVAVSIRSHDQEITGAADTPSISTRDARAVWGGKLSPRPLRTTELRELPFTSLLAGARQEYVKEEKRRAPWRQSRRADLKDSATGHPLLSEEELSAAATTDAAHLAMMEAKPKRRGRPPDYTQSQLEEVARVYTEAWLTTSGHPHPTAEVSERLGYSRARASKLVMAAREALLLGPTERGKAGGIIPPGQGRVSGPDTSSNGEETP